MANGDDLPDDVVDLIVHKLPLKSILKFRCCSTKWSYRLSDKRFSQMHYKLARCQKTVNQRLIITSSSQTQMESLDLQEKSSSFRKLTCPFLQRQVHQITLLGSSSGLVCASLDPHKNFYLWNPSTSFFRKLPDPDFSGNFSEEEDDVDFTVYHYGFGCVAATDDYKLLIGFRIDDSDFELFLLFSWKNQTWSDISGAPEWIDLIKQRQGVLSNEKLHWLFDHNHGFYELDEEEDCILAFDLENEVFGELSLPRCDDNNDEDLEYANLLGVSSEGRLYLLHRMKGLSKMICTSIWCMKEYGVTDSWTKLFDLKISHVPLEPIMNLAPIFVVEKYSSYGYRNAFTEIKYQHHPQPRIDFLKRENLADMLVCEETLVRLDDPPEEEEEEEEEAS